MLALLSPAKTLNEEQSVQQGLEAPQFRKQSGELISILKEYSTDQIKDLMHISDKLAALNQGRYHAYNPRYNAKNSKAAIYMFKGDVYQGFDAESLEVYEGWALLNGVPVSTGTFTETTGPDASSRFSEAGGPPFPGEEFLLNAPDGYEFPINLAGQSIMISMEPVPDNSPKPFVLKPLLSEIPADAEVNTVLEINRNRSFPTGTATR